MGDLVEAVSWDPSGLGLDRRNGKGVTAAGTVMATDSRYSASRTRFRRVFALLNRSV